MDEHILIFFLMMATLTLAIQGTKSLSSALKTTLLLVTALKYLTIFRTSVPLLQATYLIHHAL